MTINDVHTILDRFYDGTSTPADIEALRRFFAETTDIPAELAPDAAIFRGFNDVGDIPSAELVLGRDLLEKVDVASRRQRPLPKVLVWATVAAAACVAAVLLINPPTDNTLVRPASNQPRMLTANAVIDTEISDTTAMNIDAPEQAATPSTANKATSRPPESRPMAPREVRHAEIAVDDGFVEINDSATAVRYIAKAYRNIDRSVAVVSNSVSDADRSIDRSSRFIASTLKNL